jgi:hypothetical protein
MATLYISGQLMSLNHRQGGWVSVEILEPGKQYAKKLDTKKPELVGAAQSMVGQMVTAMYNEVDSGTPNPHRPGSNFINRYLEQITLGYTDVSGYNPPAPAPTPVPIPQQQYAPQPIPQAPAPQAPQPQPMPMQPQMQAQPRISDVERDRKIVRQSCLKVAAMMLPMFDTSEQTLATLVRVSEQLSKYVHEGVPWDTAPISPGNQRQAALPPPQQQAQGYEHDAAYDGDPGPAYTEYAGETEY